MKTKPSRRVVFVLSTLSLGLAATNAAAAPRAGSNELRIENAYLFPGLGSVSGITRLSIEDESMTMAGLGFAYGRFLTDNVELGSAFNLTYITSGDDASGDSSQTTFGLTPFIRFFSMVSNNVGLFGGIAGGYARASPDSGPSITIITAGIDAGAELFIGSDWSLRVGPMYRYIDESMSSGGVSLSATGNAFGVSWALAGYF